MNYWVFFLCQRIDTALHGILSVMLWYAIWYAILILHRTWDKVCIIERKVTGIKSVFAVTNKLVDGFRTVFTASK